MRILISWNLILYTFFCTKIKKFTIVHFFSLDACSRPRCKVLDIHSDVVDNNVRMELGGERYDFMKSKFRSNLCSLRLNILHMVR